MSDILFGVEAAMCSGQKPHPPDEKALGDLLFAAWQLCGDVHCLSTKVSSYDESFAADICSECGHVSVGVRILSITLGRFSAGKSG